jgi:hypothetical protein
MRLTGVHAETGCGAASAANTAMTAACLMTNFPFRVT